MSANFSIPYGYNAEGQTFPSYAADRHLITFGPTRSGKGATVIVQALLEVPHSVLCIDPKGQNAAITARRRRSMGQVYALNPFGLHTGAPWHLPQSRFNPLSHLSALSDNLVADVSSLAEALILTKGRDPYFDDTARDIVKAIILYLVTDGKQTATLPEMRRLLTQEEEPFTKMLATMTLSPFPFVRQSAARFLKDTRDIQSSISSAITQTAFLDDPLLADPQHGALTGNDFNMLELKRKATTIFVILPGRYMEAYARLFRLIVTTAVDQLTAEPGGYPTLMLLDEFAALQNLPAISKAYGFAAGYNLQCWGFLQDLPQLKAIYQDKWESFIANAGMLQFFTPSDLTTARYLQERGGMMTGETRSQSLAGTVGKPQHSQQVSETRVPLLPLEEMMSMASGRQVIFFGGQHSPLMSTRQPYYSIKRLKGRYDPDPFHT
jgi:type IV secretion system protein VirD4